MVGRLLVGFVWLNLQFSVSWLVDFQWGSCGSIFSFLCHGWQTFSGVRVAQSLVFCVMVGRSLVEFVWLNLQFSVSWLVDFQWGSCGSIFSFLCHGWQTFSGVRVAQSLVLCNGWYIFSGVRVAQSLVLCVMVGIFLVGFVQLFLCHGRQTFSGIRVAQCLVFYVMVGKLLVGFVWLNLQFSVSWLVDFQWGSCGSIFSFLCHGLQTFSGARVAQSLVFCVIVGRLLVGSVWLNLQFSVSWQLDFQWGSCGSIFSFLCHGWQTFSGVRVAQSLVFCVMIGRHLVGFVWLNLQFSVSWQVDFQWVSCRSIFSFVSWQVDVQWGSCGSTFSLLCHGRQILVGFVWLNLQFSVSWLVDFQWGSCGSIFSFLCHGRQIFSGVRVAQSLIFCVMVDRLLVGFVWFNLQFFVSWLVDFQWGSCGSIFRFLCHGRQTFSGVREAQTLVFCVMVGRLLVGFLWLNLQFCVMVGRFLVGFVWLNRQFSVSWQVDFQWGSCGSIQFSVSWLVDFQWGSCGSIFRFLFHGRQTFSGARVAQSLVFCVMVGRLLVGFVWLNLQLSVSWFVDFQWGSCGSIFNFLCHG